MLVDKSSASRINTAMVTKRPYNARKREEQKADTQSRIIDAALARFAMHGYDGTGLRDVAKDAGVTHAVIRLHFGTKEELWRAAVTLLFARFRHEISMPEDSGPVDLRELLTRYVRYCAKHPEHVRIMIHESIGDSDRLAWMAETFIKPGHDRLRPLLEAEIARGAIPAISLMSLTYMLSSAAQSLFMLGSEARHIYKINVYDEEVIEAHINGLLTLIMQPSH